jgi:hypothetical protein
VKEGFMVKQKVVVIFESRSAAAEAMRAALTAFRESGSAEIVIASDGIESVRAPGIENVSVDQQADVVTGQMTGLVIENLG